MTKLHLPMTEMPGVIRESARSVLKARGYQLVRVEPLMGPPYGEIVPLTDAEVDGLLRELGNNASQALFSIDTNPENVAD